MSPLSENLRVLLVEDDRDLADVTGAALMQQGLEVTVAYDGEQGLQLAEREHPDVVITDIIMPGLDGLDLIRRLLGGGAAPPVIAVSAVGSRLHSARQLGAVEALVKPVDPQDLAAAARKAHRRTQA